MGVLSDFIIADRSEAVAINDAQGSHLKQWPCLESKGINTVKLATLWAILSGTEYDSGFMLDESILDQPTDEGPWVFLVPDQLVSAVFSIGNDRIEFVAREWAKTEEFKLDRWPEPEVIAYLKQFVEFARKARAQNKDLLLWMCL